LLPNAKYFLHFLRQPRSVNVFCSLRAATISTLLSHSLDSD
jgi:hypothetical protein